MASGDPLFSFDASAGIPPGSSRAGGKVLAGGSTPAERLFARGFDAAAVEYHDFFVPALPNAYASGGLTFTVKAQMQSDTNTAHKVRWEIAIRRLDTAEDLGAAHTYDFNGASPTIPNDVNKTFTADVTFGNGADMDAWAVGEPAIIRVRRKSDHADDDATGDAYLVGLACRET